ncbi:MAG: hypothetical protein ACI9K2_005202 [Myxococcota bacterium]|jgi:hypothetical protein
MRTRTLLTLALTACGPSSGPAAEWADVLPDDRVRVALPDTSGQRAVGAPSEFRQLAVDVASQVNGLVDDVLSDVSEITSFDPTWADEDAQVAQWGPWRDDALHETRLWVTRDADDLTRWGADLRDIGGGDDEWVTLVAGEVDPGATRRESTGRFVFDFDGIHARVPAETTVGAFAVEYALDGGVADATASFVDYADHPDDLRVDAAYRYTSDGDGGGSLDVAAETELTDGGLLEVLVLRTRWLASGAGRGDALATDGDLGPLVYTASECWDAAANIVFAENNADLEREGDAEACAFREASFSE